MLEEPRGRTLAAGRREACQVEGEWRAGTGTASANERKEARTVWHAQEREKGLWWWEGWEFYWVEARKAGWEVTI